MLQSNSLSLFNPLIRKRLAPPRTTSTCKRSRFRCAYSDVPSITQLLSHPLNSNGRLHSAPLCLHRALPAVLQPCRTLVHNLYEFNEIAHQKPMS